MKPDSDHLASTLAESAPDDLPIAGMKTPYGWPLMAGAYVGLLFWVVGVPEAREQFKTDTGHDLDRVLLGRGLPAMIDKATGYDKDVVRMFADWVTETCWGDGTDPDEPEAAPLTVERVNASIEAAIEASRRREVMLNALPDADKSKDGTK